MAFSNPSPQAPNPSLELSSTETTFLQDSIEGGPYGNPEFYQAYEECMQEVLGSFRILQKKGNPEDLEIAKRFLFSPKRLVQIASPPFEKEAFKEHVKAQMNVFCDQSELNSTQQQLILRALTYIGDYCAKNHMSLPLLVAWDKMKESGLCPRENCLGSYLYILNSLPSSLHTESESLNDSYNSGDVTGEVAFYHDMLYKPTENTVSIRIKALVEEGHAAEAEKLLWNLESNASPSNEKASNTKKQKKESDSGMLRLRTCVPVLQYYCKHGDVMCGLKLYQKMRKAPSVHFEPDTYTLILASLAKRGYFCDNSKGIGDFEKLGYEAGKGGILFNTLVAEMADDVLEITSASAREIRNGFASGFGTCKSARNIYEVPYDCDLAAVIDEAFTDELVANRVTIDADSTVCNRTKAELRLILLEENQRQQVHDTLLEMADMQFEAYEAKLQRKGNQPPAMEDNYAGKHLEGFANWLNNREGKPFTAIVDGANVAYYGLGSINYHQIKLMVKSLKEMGEYPLVIMPQKYTQRKFHLRQGYVQELPQAQMDIIENLENEGIFYKVPPRCLDDYYWMLSSVSNQTASRDGIDLDVSTAGTTGKRWPGTRPILLSNDQMRDHKLELLEPRLFRRWVSSHIVNYHFPPFLNDVDEDRNISFTPADSISCEIQGNPTPTCDGNEDDVLAWHFPVKDWPKGDRFCIRIPKI